MSLRQNMLADAIIAGKALVIRFLPGFDDSNHTRQATGLPNHLAWCLGHLALTMARTAERLDGVPPAESDFIAGTRGDRERFGIESVSFNSTPADDPGNYPTFARCVQIFENACDRLAAAARAASDSKLDSMTKWGATDIPLWNAVARMLFHNGTHTGQIIDLRRALGFGRVLI